MAGKRISKSRTAYGQELRERREAAGLTQEQLSELAVMSRTHIAHIEAGRRKPAPDDARRLDRVLNTGGVFGRFLPTLDARSLAEYFEQVAEFEQQATVIREYGATLVPGLLQTEAYARAVFRAYYPPKSAEECDGFLVTRLERASILADQVSPVLWVLLDEAVVRRPVGGPEVMAAQLRHIVELAERERIRLHVLPFSAGAHSLLESSVTLMWFDDAPPIAYVEGLHSGTLHDEPTVVLDSQAAYYRALGDARSHEESLGLLRAVAEDYEHERPR
ncbi:Scr1 family TA system antitoxin-like transcriptional regulator [Streptomyces sp. NPDC017056]|uniref:helix-turn-helix domain-containing protein n=1 Tax=Streptomyces sp. NPDC017056 TaxID=3364973 RepID=UPI00378D49DB